MAVHDLQVIDPKTRKKFREWLVLHWQQAGSVWIVIYKGHTAAALLRRIDVVEECLCFGWIDSRPRKMDQDKYCLLISPRKPKSVWSAVNKKIIAKLIRNKQMTTAGLAKISSAKKNGSWKRLDQSDKLILPAELKKAFSKNAAAYKRFSEMSVSSRRALLEWIYSSKTVTTRLARVNKVVALSAKQDC